MYEKLQRPIISALTRNVPHKDIEDNLTIKWDINAYLNRKDATECMAIKLGCGDTRDRFGLIDKLEYDIDLFMLNPNYTFEQKAQLLPPAYKNGFIRTNGTLDQIIKYMDNSKASMLQTRKDLTLEFWDKFTDAKITSSLINSFKYENIQYHISLSKQGKQSLFDKYISLEILSGHCEVKLKDIQSIYDVVYNRETMNNLAKTLSCEDILKIGINNFKIRFLTKNRDIDRILDHLDNKTRMKAFKYTLNLHIDTIRKYNVPIGIMMRYNYNISIKDLDRKYNCMDRVRNRSIDEVRINSDNLDKDEYIAHNKDVTLRDFELCINKFYGILKRNVIPMKINISAYNDIDIFVI
ncbi:hypothetical protein D3C87_929560 [compost metagenome]